MDTLQIIDSMVMNSGKLERMGIYHALNMIADDVTNSSRLHDADMLNESNINIMVSTLFAPQLVFIPSINAEKNYISVSVTCALIIELRLRMLIKSTNFVARIFNPDVKKKYRLLCDMNRYTRHLISELKRNNLLESTVVKLFDKGDSISAENENLDNENSSHDVDVKIFEAIGDTKKGLPTITSNMPDIIKCKPYEIKKYGEKYTLFYVRNPPLQAFAEPHTRELIKYVYVAALVDSSYVFPVHYVTAELSITGSIFLCEIDGQGNHVNYGSSEDWSDIKKFGLKSKELVETYISYKC